VHWRNVAPAECECTLSECLNISISTQNNFECLQQNNIISARTKRLILNSVKTTRETEYFHRIYFYMNPKCYKLFRWNDFYEVDKAKLSRGINLFRPSSSKYFSWSKINSCHLAYLYTKWKTELFALGS